MKTDSDVEIEGVDMDADEEGIRQTAMRTMVMTITKMLRRLSPVPQTEMKTKFPWRLKKRRSRKKGTYGASCRLRRKAEQTVSEKGCLRVQERL
jgi:hypothetical protein